MLLLSAREAADRLGVKIDTLYAYVSRGLLRSMEVVGSRERHYDADEVESFRAGRGATRARPAEDLIPVIGSAICLIEDHRLYYRGRDALDLADNATLEEVAGILWEAPTSAAAVPHPPIPAGQARGLAANAALGPSLSPQAGRAVFSSLSPRLREEGRGEGQQLPGIIERCQMRLAEMSAGDHAALDLSRAGVVRTGRLILAELTACACGREPAALPVHEQLAAAWSLDEAGAGLVRCALVLLADHELNASTFVARCIASTGATPYAAVSGALSALSGWRHGGASSQAEALFRELADSAEPWPIMAARLQRGEALPGLGQPLYPQGDPRALAIIDALIAARPEAGRRVAKAAVAGMELTGQAPNVDFALGAAATALGLAPGAALAIFLVARSVGWIAHAIEQYESGVLIRPRARYTGRR
ncbi:MAG TPA: citrate synthase family protein [Stellaceae bacterium]|nr:citrate synthase family protein [Stellaceae bacterium]